MSSQFYFHYSLKMEAYIGHFTLSCCRPIEQHHIEPVRSISEFGFVFCDMAHTQQAVM